MRNLKFFIHGLLIVGFLSACATPQPTSTVAVDPEACVGQVGPIPEGLTLVENADLQNSALGKAGEGKLCEGKVYEAIRPVLVYRVWDKSKSYTAYGRWWSFDAPGNDKATYQKENDICPEWSALNVVHSCWIKPGEQIVVGPGQSAKCETEFLPKSATNQVYIPNDTRNDIKLVENCSSPKDWPEN